MLVASMLGITGFEVGKSKLLISRMGNQYAFEAGYLGVFVDLHVL